MATSKDNDSYYDVLLLGRTGQGKSTTGNKLLQQSDQTTEESTAGLSLKAGTGGKHFKEGKSYVSTTKECLLGVNDAKKIRVLDTPGFADTERTRHQGVYKGNLDTVRSIVRLQDHNNLEFRRVLYFLPQRGPLEKADGCLQEELRIIHGFFGDDIFNNMVIVATSYYRERKPQLVLDEEDLELTRKSFLATLDIIISAKERGLSECPPIIFLPYNEENIFTKIDSAPVLNELKKIGKKLQITKRCIRCSAKLIYKDDKLDRVVVKEGGEDEHMVSYNSSKCHPIFNRKVEVKRSWLFFHSTTVIELCARCGKNPGSEPCTGVGQMFKWKTSVHGDINISTCHSC